MFQLLSILTTSSSSPAFAVALQGAWAFGQWDAKLVARLLELMTPGNARVDVQSAKWDTVCAVISQVPQPPVLQQLLQTTPQHMKSSRMQHRHATAGSRQGVMTCHSTRKNHRRGGGFPGAIPDWGRSDSAGCRAPRAHPTRLQTHPSAPSIGIHPVHQSLYPYRRLRSVSCRRAALRRGLGLSPA